MNLGLLPGAQGTQRLPRVAALPVALPMILQGRPVNVARPACRCCLWQLAFEAEAAKKNGIIDSVAKGDAAWIGVGMCHRLCMSPAISLFQVVEEVAAFALSHPPAPISKREVQPRQSRSLAVEMHEHVPDT